MSKLGSLYIKLGEPDGELCGGGCEVDGWAADEIEQLMVDLSTTHQQLDAEREAHQRHDQTFLEMCQVELDLRQQLLAAQVEVKRLRDAIADYVEANNASWLEISNAAIAAGTSTVVLTDKQAAALNQYCALRDAIATPPDLSALSLFAAQKQREVLEKAIAILNRFTEMAESGAGYVMHWGERTEQIARELRRMLAELDQAPQGEKQCKPQE